MNYGIPYMGSKSKICESICRILPSADNFYDLFGGGFSVTHFMLKHRSKEFKQFHFNEIRPGICNLIQEAISGKYNYERYKPEWISREDFFRLKEIDPMVRVVWSFGNNGEDYLFGKGFEQDKKSIHMAVVFNQFDDFSKEVFGMEKFKDGFGINEKRLFLRSRIKLLGRDRPDILHLLRIQQLEQLQQLERIQQLEQLQFYSGSYEQVKIKENSIIYCDIPYKGTADYGGFNHSKFFDWAAEQSSPLFISEYNIDDKRFKQIDSFEKRSMISANKDLTLIKKEKVYVNMAGYKKILSRFKDK